MVECNICYNDISYGINCFAKCKIVICHYCFLNLLKLNDSIEYCCPQCRHTSIKNKDRRFTKFINKNKKCLEKWLNFLKRNWSKQMQDNYLTLGKSSTDELIKKYILLYILIMMFLFQMINYVSFYLQYHNYWLVCFV